VRLQEVVAERQEAIRRASEEKIQAARRGTDALKAELERETIRARALAEAEGRAAEARANADVNLALMRARVAAEAEKYTALVSTALSSVGSGLHTLLGDPRTAGAACATVTALALGYFGAREGARVTAAHAARLLGTPSLVRETTRGGLLSSARGVHRPSRRAAADTAELLADVVLPPALRERVAALAGSTASARARGAPLRNVMFHGPPGTGKTLVARALALHSGLDYAIMSGGDVAPLGAKAVTEIHELFEWASRSQRGVLLFVDEADAFCARRGGGAAPAGAAAGGAEEVRAALNALLYRTGGQSSSLALVVATNRPAELDEAVLDRMDESLEFPLPGQAERRALVQLYYERYVLAPPAAPAGPFWAARAQPPAITPDADVTDALLQEAAHVTEGFSGRELAKLMLSVQAAVYGRAGGEAAGGALRLSAAQFERVLHDKVAEHADKRHWRHA
jgi:ATPase family AAA domain-containing protein 3A/B